MKQQYKRLCDALHEQSSCKRYLFSFSLLLVVWGVWYTTLYQWLHTTSHKYQELIAQTTTKFAHESQLNKQTFEIAKSIDALRSQLHQQADKNITMLDVIQAAQNCGLSITRYQIEKEKKENEYCTLLYAQAEFTGSLHNICTFVAASNKNNFPMNFDRIKITHQNAQNYVLSCALQILKSEESKIPSTL